MRSRDDTIDHATTSAAPGPQSGLSRCLNGRAGRTAFSGRAMNYPDRVLCRLVLASVRKDLQRVDSLCREGLVWSIEGWPAGPLSPVPVGAVRIDRNFRVTEL